MALIRGFIRIYLCLPGQVENLEEIPEYEGQPYVVVNENEPSFSDEDKNGPAYEYYSELVPLEDVALRKQKSAGSLCLWRNGGPLVQ